MRLPRVTVGKWMILMAVIALNFAVIRYMEWQYYGDSELWIMTAPRGAGGVLSMGGLLTVLLPVMAVRLARSGESGGFLLGFEAFGWAAVLVGLACILFSPRSVQVYSLATYERLWLAARGEMSLLIPYDNRLACILWELSEVFAFAVPQFLFASLGGWLFRRFGIELVVRSRSRADEVPIGVDRAIRPSGVEPGGEHPCVP